MPTIEGLPPASAISPYDYHPVDQPNGDGSYTTRKMSGVLAASYFGALPSDASPVMDGTAAPGVAVTWSRSDHVHGHDSSKYDTSNPANYQTAANVTTSLSPYALTTAVTTAVGAEATRAAAAEALLAPKASPTFSGTVTIPAGAAIAGYATSAALSAAIGGVGASLIYKSYANRGDLRSLETPQFANVDGLGLFVWLSGSIEPDDDETAFVTTNGAWTLAAADPDFVFASWLADFDNVQGRASDLEGRATADEASIAALNAFQAKFLRGSFSMSLTTLAATISANFTVAVTGAAPGDSVVVNPGDAFGTAAADQGRLSHSSYVSAANTVTVSVRNASAASATLTASTWSVLVIKQ